MRKYMSCIQFGFEGKLMILISKIMQILTFHIITIGDIIRPL